MVKNENTILLWKKLKALGAFSDSYYDKQIIEEIKGALSIKTEIEEGIKEISEEELLKAFLQVLSPLISMYTDILRLFEKASADSSDSNLEIKISTSKLENIQFNVSHFTHAREKVIESYTLLKRICFLKGISSGFWGIAQYGFCANGKLKKEIQSESFNEWNQIYRESGFSYIDIPVQLDFSLIIQKMSIGLLLEDAYSCWQELYDYYKSIHYNRNNWKKIQDAQKRMAKSQYVQLIQDESDGILGTSLKGLYYIAENYETMSSVDQKNAKKALEKLISKVEKRDFLTKEAVTVIEKFLKLPVWEHRHEVYSIWVCALIVSKVPDKWLSFHVKDNILSFPFSGACIVSISVDGMQYDVWTELRTKAIGKLQGEGRENAIQPDYSIVCGNPQNPNNSIVVIECKQYKRPKYKNFADAIIDYAVNRPKAKILLVNYGNINVDTLKRKITIPEKRYLPFAICRPDSEMAEKFSDTVMLAVKEKRLINIDLETPVLFTLRWDKYPKDLDIHLFFRPEKSFLIHETSYKQNSILDVEFSDDIRSGFGPEIISAC